MKSIAFGWYGSKNCGPRSCNARVCPLVVRPARLTKLLMLLGQATKAGAAAGGKGGRVWVSFTGPDCRDGPLTVVFSGMAKKDHVSLTPATQLLKAHKVVFAEHPYDYLEHGGALHSSAALGRDPYTVVKTLIMQDQDARPLVVLMHGNRKVSTKNLARQIGAKSVAPCTPEVASRHSGYQVGGTSPFGTRRVMPVFIEASILALPEILINGGRRGYLIGLDPQVCVSLLGAKPVQCALSLQD